MRVLGIFIFLMASLFPVTTTLWGQQDQRTEALGAFKEIKVYDGISLRLIPSDRNEIVIRGEDIDKVAIVNTSGVLKVRMQITRMFSGYRTFADLYYKDAPTVIDVNEDALVETDATLRQEILEVKAQEGGEIRLQAEVTQFLVKAVTGGLITAEGRSENQDIQINTGGIYHGQNFNTGFCTVNVNAGSTAEIHATDYVKATVKAGGKVFVYGNPDKMDEKTVFGGTIKRM